MISYRFSWIQSFVCQEVAGGEEPTYQRAPQCEEYGTTSTKQRLRTCDNVQNILTILCGLLASFINSVLSKCIGQSILN